MSSVIDPSSTVSSPAKNKKNKSGDRPSAHLSPVTDRIDTPPATQTALPANPAENDLENSLLSDVKNNQQPSDGKETKQLRRWDNVSYAALAWLIMAHVVVVTMAIPYFSWTGLAVAIVLHWITGSLGICLGYHRLLTHTGMKTFPWVRNLFATIGTFAGEGTPLDWVADHRKHHAFSDHDGDPHSPNDGAWWSHMLWLAYRTHNGQRDAYLKRWVPDLYKQWYMRALDYLFLPLHIASGFALLGIGYAIGGFDFGVSLVVWGLFVRLVTVLHATWMVNSASHMWGYRNYETTDDSRNNWLVAIVAYGEGWHNNHHAYPRMAKHGHQWWEFDITWQAIRLLKACGLVWDVVDYRNAAEKREKLAAAEKKAA